MPIWIRSHRVSRATWPASATVWQSCPSRTWDHGSIPARPEWSHSTYSPPFARAPWSTSTSRPTACRPLLTQMLGAAIVQDLQTTVAALQGRPTPTLVVIDEFSAIAGHARR